MADKLKGKTTPVRAYPHPSDSRANIPTAELESFARPEEKKPATVRYPRDPTLDPLALVEELYVGPRPRGTLWTTSPPVEYEDR